MSMKTWKSVMLPKKQVKNFKHPMYTHMFNEKGMRKLYIQFQKQKEKKYNTKNGSLRKKVKTKGEGLASTITLLTK